MLKCILFVSFFCPFLSLAQVAKFTLEEKAASSQKSSQLAAVAADCLDWHYQDHLQFFNHWGISKYYGNRRKDYATQQGLIAALQGYNKPVDLVRQLEPISCIGLTMKCLGQAFEEVGMGTTWQKVYEQLKKDNKFYGTDLQKNLLALGWKSYYWNPQPDMNAVWDQEDQTLNPLRPGKQWNPVWGGHAYRYEQVKQRGYYFEKELVVNDAVSLVGFGDVQPRFFKEVSFFVGVAHAGYHVFPGRRGEVIEAHSMRDLNSIDNLQFSEFNPLKAGGGPRWTRTEKYRSGLLVVPPL